MFSDRNVAWSPSETNAISAAPKGRVAPVRQAVNDRLPDGNPVVPFSSVAADHGVTPPALDTLLEHLPVGIWLADRDGRVVFANEAARALCVDRLETLKWALTRALLTEEAVGEDEIEIVTEGQPRRWLSAHVIPVRVAGRGVTGAFVTLTDVTARNRMRQWNPLIETLVNL